MKVAHRGDTTHCTNPYNLAEPEYVIRTSWETSSPAAGNDLF